MKSACAKFWKDNKKYYGILKFPTRPFLSCFQTSSLAHAFLEKKLYGHDMDISPRVSREGLNGLVAVNFEYFERWRLSSRNFGPRVQINVIFCIN